MGRVSPPARKAASKKRGARYSYPGEMSARRAAAEETTSEGPVSSSAMRRAEKRRRGKESREGGGRVNDEKTEPKNATRELRASRDASREKRAARGGGCIKRRGGGGGGRRGERREYTVRTHSRDYAAEYDRTMRAQGRSCAEVRASRYRRNRTSALTSKGLRIPATTRLRFNNLRTKSRQKRDRSAAVRAKLK